MPTSPMMSGWLRGPVIFRLARAEPPDAMPLTKALSTRRSSAPATPRSSDGVRPVRVRSARGHDRVALGGPLEILDLGAPVLEPETGRDALGERHSGERDRRAIEHGGRLDRDRATADRLRLRPSRTRLPCISRSRSGASTSFNIACVMLLARIVNRARAGSAGSAFNHAVRRDGGAPGWFDGGCAELRTTRQGNAPSAASDMPCHSAATRAQCDERRIDERIDSQAGDRREARHTSATATARRACRPAADGSACRRPSDRGLPSITLYRAPASRRSRAIRSRSAPRADRRGAPAADPASAVTPS